MLSIDLGITRPVRLIVSSKIRVPATWGLCRSTVMLPAEYESWSRETLDRALLHELAHVRRRDCWSYLLAEGNLAARWVQGTEFTTTPTRLTPTKDWDVGVYSVELANLMFGSNLAVPIAQEKDGLTVSFTLDSQPVTILNDPGIVELADDGVAADPLYGTAKGLYFIQIDSAVSDAQLEVHFKYVNSNIFFT